MNISLDTVLSALDMQSAHIVSANSFSIHQPQLNAAALWSKDESVSRNLCYVIPARQVREDFALPPRTSVVIVGTVDENILRMSDVDALVIDIPVKRAAFNTWFNRYQRWQRFRSFA